MTKDNSLLIPEESLISKIYFLRNKNVMLDNELADLYGVSTRRINEQVKRNINRFPDDFMFQLTLKEWINLKSQFATSRWGGRRKLPYVFTEHGVLMLSSVLNSERAINVNIQIMRLFTKMKEMFQKNKDLLLKFEKIEAVVEKQGKNISLVFEYLDQLINKKEEPRKIVGFKQKTK